MGCGFVTPSCTHTVSPPRSWGGLGNVIPIYAGLAMREAFPRNCTIVFNESRAFRFSEHFLPPGKIPRGWRPDGSGGYHINCAIRALTHRPSAAATSKLIVMQSHMRRQWARERRGGGTAAAEGGAAVSTRALQPCMAPAGVCCNHTNGMNADGRPHHRLVGVQVRTLWADARLHAAPFECNADAQAGGGHAAAALDAWLALLLSPDFATPPPPKRPTTNPTSPSKTSNRGTISATDTERSAPRALSPMPSVSVLVDRIVDVVRSRFGGSTPWSLLVASDSPALKAALVANARDRYGIDALASPGSVGHNNLPDELRSGDADARAEAISAAATAVADVVALSRADLVIAVHEKQMSSFSRVARKMAVCPQQHLEWRIHTQRFYLHPLVVSLWKDATINASRVLARGVSSASGRQSGGGGRRSRSDPVPEAEQAQRRKSRVDCVRDCFGIDLGARSGIARTREGVQPKVTIPHGTTLPTGGSGGGGGGVPLFDLAKPDGLVGTPETALACRHACACFVRAALGDGSERRLARARFGLMAWKHHNSKI
jgi:hypothetical protein